MGFYCDNCGEKVEIDSDECPGCGVLFKAVKCPRCGFTGPSVQFARGCPSCGYLGKSSNNENHKRIPVKKKEVFKQYLSDKTFWILGGVLLLLIPVLIILLLNN